MFPYCSDIVGWVTLQASDLLKKLVKIILRGHDLLWRTAEIEVSTG